MCVPVAHRDVCGISRWVDRMWMAWLVDDASAVGLEWHMRGGGDDADSQAKSVRNNVSVA